MKGSDKTLLLIVGGVILLVIAAFSFVLLRPEPEYIAGDNPEGVVHNYLLALRRDDYERAYPAISKNSKVGNFGNFVDSAENYWSFDLDSNVALVIDETIMTGENLARVKVRKTRTNNDVLGSSQYSETFSMRLKKEAGEWKIVGSDQYWDSCWDPDSNCK